MTPNCPSCSLLTWAASEKIFIPLSERSCERRNGHSWSTRWRTKKTNLQDNEYFSLHIFDRPCKEGYTLQHLKWRQPRFFSLWCLEESKHFLALWTKLWGFHMHQFLLREFCCAELQMYWSQALRRTQAGQDVYLDKFIISEWAHAQPTIQFFYSHKKSMSTSFWINVSSRVASV